MIKKHFMELSIKVRMVKTKEKRMMKKALINLVRILELIEVEWMN